MDVTPHELRAIELREAWRGYKQDEVDRLLDRVAGTIERLQGQVQRLSERLTHAESEAGVGREADEMLRRTLLLAQRTADATVAEAQERARRVLSESEAHAHSIVSSAEEEARRLAIAERQRVENEVRDLASRRDLLLADVEALEEAGREHRRRLREFLEAEIARVDARVLPEAPALPEMADVDLAAVERSEEGVEEPSQMEPSETEPDATFEEAGDAVDAAEAQWVEDDVDADDIDADPWAPEPAEAGDLLPGRRRRWRARDAEPGLEPPDDRFFDELRQAVHDDTPLGPRDDDSGDGDAYASASADPDDGRSRT